MASVWDSRRDWEVSQTLSLLSRRRTLEVQGAKLEILARRQARLAKEELASLIDAEVGLGQVVSRPFLILLLFLLINRGRLKSKRPRPNFYKASNRRLLRRKRSVFMSLLMITIDYVQMLIAGPSVINLTVLRVIRKVSLSL